MLRYPSHIKKIYPKNLIWRFIKNNKIKIKKTGWDSHQSGIREIAFYSVFPIPKKKSFFDFFDGQSDRIINGNLQGEKNNIIIR